MLSISLAAAFVCGVLGFVLYHFQTRHASTVLIDRANALAEEEKWHAAASYLYRYLAIAPDDDDIRVRMTDYYVSSAKNPGTIRRAVSVIYQTLGRLPENDERRLELRRSLTRLLFEQGNFSAAQNEAHGLLDNDNDDNLALRIWALSYWARAQWDSTVSHSEAQQALERAIEILPHDVELATAVADFYVKNAENPEVLQAQPEPLTRADQVMDALVTNIPDNPKAWLSRYGHRKRRGLGGGQADLEMALEIDPDNIDALFQRALTGIQENTPESMKSAAGDLRRILEQDAQYEAAYMALGHLHMVRKDADRAVQVFQKGRSLEGDDSLELGTRLGEALLLANRLDDVETLLPDLDTEFKAAISGLDADRRLYLESSLKLLRAGFLMAQGSHNDAIPILRSTIVAVTPRSGQEWAKKLLIRSNRLAADAWTRSEVFEQAATSWAQVAALDPKMTVARFIAGQQYFRAGLYADAIPQFESYLESENHDPVEQRDEALLSLLQAHLALQLKNAPDHRKWSEFERLLESARDQLPDRWEVDIAAADKLSAIDSPQATEEARQQLASAAEKYGNQPQFWRAATSVYRRLGLADEADRALAQFGQLAPSPREAVLFKCTVLARDGRFDEADQLLTELQAQAREKDKQALQVLRIRYAFGANNLEFARELLHEFDVEGNVEAANDPDLLLLGTELALTDGDYHAARNWERRLREQKGEHDFQVRFLRLRRLMGEYDDLNAKQRDEVAVLVDQLRSERPRWYPILALSAHFAELTGDFELAQRQYELAIQLGDRRLAILQRYAGLLYRFGRFADAERVLAYIPTGASTEIGLDAMAVSVAVQQQQLDEATVLAAESAARNPDDPKRALWHANLLNMTGKTEEAEQRFKELRQKFPKDLGVWGGWFTFLLRADRREEAAAHVETLTAEIDMDQPLSEFIKGQAFEQLGQLPKARQHYEAAVNLEPDNIQYRNRLAKLLLSVDIVAALAQLEEVVRQAPENHEARQRLAALLATSNNEADWARIDELLAEFGGAPSAEDRRLKAILLSRRGRDRPTRASNCRRAVRIMSELISDSNQPVNDMDEILIAGMYGQLYLFEGEIADLENARTHLRKLINRPVPPVQYLMLYTEFLLQHAPAAGDHLSEDQQGLRESYLAEAQLELDQLYSMAMNEHEIVPIPLFQLRLKLLEAQGQRNDIRQAVRDYSVSLLAELSSDAERASAYRVLGDLLTGFQFRREAEQWYRKLAEITPQGNLMLASSLAARGQIQDAMELCLETARDKRLQTEGDMPNTNVVKLMAQLLATVDHSQREFEQIAPVITAAVREDPTNVELLTAAAVLNAKHGNEIEALDLFRKILQHDEENVLALNNAATLLGELPGYYQQALDYVERAIKIAGRRVSLLDTQGTIYLWAGEGEQAVASLEEAAASTVSDPRIHLHLAGAYEIVGNTDSARAAFQDATKLGIDEQILTQHDERLLKRLRKQFADAALTN